MNHEKEVRELLERLVHKYQTLEKQKRTYGTEFEMTQAEIHTIAFIGENPGEKQDTLAKSKGITKGATSQMISRLVEKGLVERRNSETSNAEVALYLTENGLKAYEGHKKYHEQEENSLRHTFEQFTTEEYENFVKVLRACDEIL